MEFKKILWPTDFSSSAEKVVKNAPVPVITIPTEQMQ